MSETNTPRASGPKHSAKLLVVDDDPLVLTAVTRILTREGYAVATATDAAQALRVLASEPIDILISDIDMPGMSGTELVARVRQLFPDVVRILLSGRGSLDAALAAINEGEVYRFLTKPIARQVLLDTLREGVERMEELRRTNAAQRVASHRTELLEALEREHPGITSIAMLDGAYLLEVDRLEKLARTTQMPALRMLLATK